MKHISALLLLVMFIPQISFAQISLSTKFENYYDDNIYNNALKVSDFVNSFSLSSSYDFESEYNNFQVYYMGNVSYFQKNLFKSSNSHKIGVVNTYLFSEDGNPLNVGINYSFRNNREDFAIFDYDQLSIYANYNQTLSENDFLVSGYLFKRNNYKNFPIFTHNEHKVFAKLTKSFETKTTLMSGVEMDIKAYSEKLQGPSVSNTVSQGRLYLQLAQSLTENLGISGYTLIRKNLNSGTRYITADDLIFYEEEIFNDVYSNDGYELGLKLTAVLSPLITTRFEYFYSVRNYSDLPVADPEGYILNEMRKDHQSAFGLEMELNLNSILSDFTTEINWNYITNSSNDVYYDFNNQLMSVSFIWGM